MKQSVSISEAQKGEESSMAMDVVDDEIRGSGMQFIEVWLDPGAGRRLVAGESLFTTDYTNTSSRELHVSFAAPFPGKILPMGSVLGGDDDEA